MRTRITLRAKRSMVTMVVGAMVAISLFAVPANAHTGGRNFPTVFGASSSQTLADDNVTDGHCVYVSYKKNGATFDNGAKSCGPVVIKYNGSTITNSRGCITGHWTCGPWVPPLIVA